MKETNSFKWAFLKLHLKKHEGEQYFLSKKCICWYLLHCVKSVQMRSFFWSYFPAFGLNTERYGVSLRIQSKCGKIRTRKNSVFRHFSRSVEIILTEAYSKRYETSQMELFVKTVGGLQLLSVFTKSFILIFDRVVNTALTRENL